MDPIREQTWKELEIYTWADLDKHQWECFRTALLESETELEVQAVIEKYSKVFYDITTKLNTTNIRNRVSRTINENTTEMITNIIVSENNYLGNMLDYLPDYERNSKVYYEIFKVIDQEFRQLEQRRKVIERNLFIDTAIERLELEERDLDIKVNDKLDYRQRREQIISRNIAIFNQTTKETIEDICNAFANGEVEVNDTDVEGMFEIKFIDQFGLPDNLQGLDEALEIIFPAHLGWKFTYTYANWGMLETKLWRDTEELTWNELRTWKEVM